MTKRDNMFLKIFRHTGYESILEGEITETGVGFVRYVNQLRVWRAQQLLRDMRYRAGEVAGMVGFDNPQYFTRIFKEMTGIVPSEYRSRICPHDDET